MQAALRVTHNINAVVEATTCIESSFSKLAMSYNHPPDRVISIKTVLDMLEDCRKLRKLQLARATHSIICINGLENHHALENFLVPMFVDCGDFLSGQQIFKKLLCPNEHSWSSLMQAYIGCHDFENVLLAYQILQADSIAPNALVYIAVLKACVRLMCIKTGQELHVDICKEAYERDLYVGSTLVDLYTKNGLLEAAYDILSELSTRDVVLWTTLIAGYVEKGLGEQALKCFEGMKADGISMDNFAFVCGLKACTSIGALDRGQQLHEELENIGLIKDHVVASAVVDMYMRCGSLLEARDVFDRLQTRDAVVWTTLIRGYSDQGLGEEALACFKQMEGDGVLPDAVTLVCTLKACGSSCSLEIGRQSNNQIYKLGFEREDFVGNMLVDMYVSCNLLSEACIVFEKLDKKDIVTWNTLLKGYAESKLGDEAFGCLEQMHRLKMAPNEITFLYLLNSCVSMITEEQNGHLIPELEKHRDRCRYLHGEIVKHGHENDGLVGNALVSLYIQYFLLQEANHIFERFRGKNVTSWNVLVEGYIDLGLSDEALSILEKMKTESVLADDVTYLYGIKACGIVGALEKGKSLHDEVVHRKALEATSSNHVKRFVAQNSSAESELLLSTALIHMYGKCGSMKDVISIFDTRPMKDHVIWNAFLSAHALQGNSYKVCASFPKMLEDGLKPNAMTFLAILTACSHGGLVEISFDYIECMYSIYNIMPNVKHYTCIVDVLGRSGRLEEAFVALTELQIQPDLILWSSMLNASGKWSNPEIGRLAFQNAVSLDENHSAAFVSFSNLYVDDENDGHS
ncbi:hypothetical protein KP509_14G089700 [Ceratopteris richardii]|uniref:Pentatricopeptide repeat-containing protein n=1 Tax=Ceratopteris richardii TaxID=49495 RepID=A0A8T2TC32_CERRI|nr:hypothetical protein KP509_14G089700 [Ceratopteris richardii]